MKRGLQLLPRVLRFGRQENGSAVAELAILVPFLLIMLGAVAELGRFFETYTTVAKATRSASRYLSNHTYSPEEQDKAKNLAICGKLSCGTERLVKGLEKTNVCIEYQFPPDSAKPETVTVRIPATAGDCGAPLQFAPIFNIGALLQNSFSLVLPISPSTTMYYMLDS